MLNSSQVVADGQLKHPALLETAFSLSSVTYWWSCILMTDAKETGKEIIFFQGYPLISFFDRDRVKPK